MLVFKNWNSLSTELGLIGHRFQTSYYTTEGRWLELRDMIQQVGDYLITGAGNGIGIYSSISAKIGTFYKNNLHIGLANFLLKGGWGGFLVIFIPGLAGILTIVVNKPHSIIQGSFTSLIVWYTMAAIGTGYNTPSMGIITQILFSQKTSSKQ